MNILVFIKEVADTEAKIVIRDDKNGLEIENKYVMNFFDEFAVEEALRIKEKIKESVVTACTFGPLRAVEVLRTAIAMGADRAFLLDKTGLDDDDPLVVAEVLSAFARKEGFDLILTGRQAIDDENSAIGPMSAELLDIPHVSAAMKLTVTDNKVLVESEAEGGRKTWEVALPALVTAQKGLNEPRVPLITGVMKAMKAVIGIVQPADLGIKPAPPRITVFSYESPPKRPPVKIVEGETGEEKVKNLVRLLKDEARVL
jgi:electron transfer flavoprotein beta subunit